MWMSSRKTKRARAWANGLGWFSLALGLTEIVAGGPLARALGVKSTKLVRAFGVREIAAGAGVLLLGRKGPGMIARIAGDILDVGVLGSALRPSNPKRWNAALAMMAVAPVIALDVICGRQLGPSR